MNIGWWVQRWSELHPEKTAVIFEGQRISYRDLHRRADKTSCWLQSLGIEKGDRVAAINYHRFNIFFNDLIRQ